MKKSLKRLDQVLYGKRHRMDVILDMHGAPGAQSNRDCRQ